VLPSVVDRRRALFAKGKRNMRKGLAALAVCVLLAMPAMAGYVSSDLVTEYTDMSGTHYRINGTSINLFEPTSPYDPSGPGPGLWGQNNSSPIDYPHVSPPYVPSPGSSGNYNLAEHTDLEGLFYFYDQNTGGLKVWLVTSMGPAGFVYNGFTYHLGDVFVNIDSDAAFEYALLGFGTRPGVASNMPVASDHVHGPWTAVNSRDAGNLAVVNGQSVLYGMNGPNSWADSSTIRGLVNPWAINNPTIADDCDLLYDVITGSAINQLDFAGGPGASYWPSGSHSTFVYLWDVILPDGLSLDLCYADFDFQITLQCGNDFLHGGVPIVPAPGALVLGLVGIASLAAFRRRRIAS